MSLEKARRMILQKMGSGEHVLLAICLELPEVPDWCDGRDQHGRAVCFVGYSQLGPMGEPPVQSSRNHHVNSGR